MRQYAKKCDSIICASIGGVASRIIPHTPNFTAVGAIAILSAIYLPKKYALLLPLVIMLLSDAIVGFHATIPWVYGSYLLIGLLSMYTGSKHLMMMPIASSILFFIITNFGVWASGTMYAKTLSGLLECYEMGIPFYRGTISGDIVFSLALCICTLGFK
jgi:hypothetical protein